ncbi:hypothetical protein ACOI1H_16635, partial [Loktanella sp. DJP18]|uniref:hypothetical protein n=1 Tax=Loktanella sp. DJP18 TaxID=3409788 RepID=UPI003BB62097
VDKAIMEIARSNPGRLIDIYDNNLDILKDLRKRKDKLNQDEKLAHDRLDMGRRAIGKSLSELGHLDPKKVERDGHPMMSRKGLHANLDALRPIGNAIAKTGDVIQKYAPEAIRKGRGLMDDLMKAADER